MDKYIIKRIHDPAEKEKVARCVLEALPDWFGIEEAREDYIRESGDQVFFAAYEEAQAIGFMTLKETGSATAELAVMGVLATHHRRGVERKLFEAGKAEARARGYAFLQVKTVQMGRYPEYDATNRFYLALGFREFEVFPMLWDECNPCQIYVMGM